MCVPKPAASAFCDQDSLSRNRQVRELFGRAWYVGIVQDDERAERRFDFEVVAVASRFQCALTMSTALGLEFGREPEVDQRIAMRIRDQIDGTAAATIAAIRPAAWNEFLAAKAERAAPPVAGSDVNIDFVYEHS